MPGADLGNHIIKKEIKKFVKTSKDSFFYKSLGQKNYFSLLGQVDAIIGNSSSGILEMPYFQKPTINLGTRQLGRLSSKSVINVGIKKNEIVKSLKKIFSSSFKKKIKKNKKFYGKEGAPLRILKVLRNLNTQNLFQKKFFNI